MHDVDQAGISAAPVARSPWAQAAALVGSFGGALGLGSLVGQMVQPTGEATAAIVTFALLLVFIGGMALWAAMAASIFSQALFNGDFALGLLRFFLRGRLREDLPKLNLDRDVIVAAGLRALGWSRVFVWLAVAVAIVTSPVVGWFATSGFVISMAIAMFVVVSYGFALRALARAGYLFPPDLDP